MSQEKVKEINQETVKLKVDEMRINQSMKVSLGLGISILINILLLSIIIAIWKYILS